MSSLTFDIEGIVELAAAGSEALDFLSQALPQACVDAGDAAVSAMQLSHPYQDRTYRLSGGMRCRLGRRTRWAALANVTFNAPYAGYVNDGTSRSRAYPFLPIGEAAAAPVLEDRMSRALDIYCKMIGAT